MHVEGMQTAGVSRKIWQSLKVSAICSYKVVNLWLFASVG